MPLESGKTVIVLRVPGGTGLYLYEGRPYQRVGATTQRMPQATYERRLLERLHGTSRWENQVAEGFGIGDLVQRDLVLAVEEAIRRQRLDDPVTTRSARVAARVGPAQLGWATPECGHGALFGATRSICRPSTRNVSCGLARFSGVTKDEFIDNRQEVGNAFDLFERAQRFLRDHLPVAGRIVPGVFQRIDEPYSIRPKHFAKRSPMRFAIGITASVAARSALRSTMTVWRSAVLKIIELVRGAGLVAPEFNGKPA